MKNPLKNRHIFFERNGKSFHGERLGQAGWRNSSRVSRYVYLSHFDDWRHHGVKRYRKCGLISRPARNLKGKQARAKRNFRKMNALRSRKNVCSVMVVAPFRGMVSNEWREDVCRSRTGLTTVAEWRGNLLPSFHTNWWESRAFPTATNNFNRKPHCTHGVEPNIILVSLGAVYKPDIFIGRLKALHMQSVCSINFFQVQKKTMKVCQSVVTKTRV